VRVSPLRYCTFADLYNQHLRPLLLLDAHRPSQLRNERQLLEDRRPLELSQFVSFVLRAADGRDAGRVVLGTYDPGGVGGFLRLAHGICLVSRESDLISSHLSYRNGGDPLLPGNLRAM